MKLCLFKKKISFQEALAIHDNNQLINSADFSYLFFKDPVNWDSQE